MKLSLPLTILMLATIPLVRAQESSPLRERLSATLKGRVVDEAGLPLPSRVDVMQQYLRDGRMRLDQRCTTETDKDGDYRCISLPAGKYIVVAHPRRPPNSMTKTGDGTGIPAFLFYPGTTDLGSALTVELQDDAVETRDFAFARQAGIKISGRIREQPNDPAFVLYAESDGHIVDTDISVRYDQRSGGFYLDGIPNGEYRLSALWSQPGGKQFHATTHLAVQGTSITGLALSATHEPSVSGHVLLQDPRQKLPRQVILRALSPTTQDVSATVQNDGSFRFSAVPEDHYVLETVGDQGECVGSTEVHGSYHAGPQLLVTPDDGNLTITVNLETKPGSIRGALEQSTHGTLVVQSEDTGVIRTAGADGNGAFLVSGLLPGSYRLFAWPSLDRVEYRNPSYLLRFKNDSAEISVGAGATADGVHVSLISRQ